MQNGRSWQWNWSFSVKIGLYLMLKLEKYLNEKKTFINSFQKLKLLIFEDYGKRKVRIISHLKSCIFHPKTLFIVIIFSCGNRIRIDTDDVNSWQSIDTECVRVCVCLCVFASEWHCNQRWKTPPYEYLPIRNATPQKIEANDVLCVIYSLYFGWRAMIFSFQCDAYVIIHRPFTL